MTENPSDPANLQGNEAYEVGYKKPPKDKQFKKGFDPRRNTRAVPKETTLIREKMRMIAAEIIGNEETSMTRFEAMLRQLWTSRNPAHNKLALQVLDPKILTEQVDVNLKGDLEIGIKQIDYRNGISIPATRSSDDSSESSQD